MGIEVVTAPTLEPVSLFEVKDMLRLDHDDHEEDDSLQQMIGAARGICEEYQDRAYVTQTLRLWLDAFPSEDYIELRRPPLQEPSVTAGSFVTGTVYRITAVGTTDFTLIGASASTVGVVFTATGAGTGTGTATASGIVGYYDTTNTVAYMNGAYTGLKLHSFVGSIYLAYGQSWPSTTLRPRNGVSVQYVAGYGVGDSVPQKVRDAIFAYVTWRYENRDSRDSGKIMEAVRGILHGEKVY